MQDFQQQTASQSCELPSAVPIPLTEEELKMVGGGIQGPVETF